MMLASRLWAKVESARGAWVYLEIASDDEGERARACVSADGGERGEVSFAKAAACD